ncbi:MAG: hypothetical protein ACD_4C00242G0004 [uncultured bacterium (gcode 4)]|uniref:Uncharacterized protein n=1 Tax=uncultured bacterium (gcode 4) TaxID=1234023 RepID=K2FXH0_9BACT|nr:MAG: hypothetical protein ACD_4C00242G0004 [uncultured bacterium (gcode 4)]
MNNKEIIIIADEWYVDYIYHEGIKEFFNRKALWIIITWAQRDPEGMWSYWLKLYFESILTPIDIKSQIDLIIKSWIDEKCIIYDSKAKNTKDNAINSKLLLEKHFPDVDNITIIWSLEWILRKYLTFKKTFKDQWSEYIKIKIKPIPY